MNLTWPHVGETIEICDAKISGREWVMKVSQFILYGPEEGECHTFINVVGLRKGTIKVFFAVFQPVTIPRP